MSSAQVPADVAELQGRIARVVWEMGMAAAGSSMPQRILAPADERVSDHQHVLAKDPTRLGYACVLPGCGRLVHVEQFDAMTTPAATESDQRASSQVRGPIEGKSAGQRLDPGWGVTPTE